MKKEHKLTFSCFFIVTTVIYIKSYYTLYYWWHISLFFGFVFFLFEMDQCFCSFNSSFGWWHHLMSMGFFFIWEPNPFTTYWPCLLPLAISLKRCFQASKSWTKGISLTMTRCEHGNVVSLNDVCFKLFSRFIFSCTLLFVNFFNRLQVIINYSLSLGLLSSSHSSFSVKSIWSIISSNLSFFSKRFINSRVSAHTSISQFSHII